MYFWINLTGRSHPVVFSVRFSILFLNSNIKNVSWNCLSLLFFGQTLVTCWPPVWRQITSTSATTRKRTSVFVDISPAMYNTRDACGSRVQRRANNSWTQTRHIQPGLPLLSLCLMVINEMPCQRLAVKGPLCNYSRLWVGTGDAPLALQRTGTGLQDIQ